MSGIHSTLARKTTTVDDLTGQRSGPHDFPAAPVDKSEIRKLETAHEPFLA